MKIRSDSPFAKLSEDECDTLVEAADETGILNVMKYLKEKPNPINCSAASFRRFLQRAREARLLRDIGEREEAVTELAKRSEDTKVREATLSAARNRMFEDALATNNRETLLEMFAALNAEKTRDREMALEERKVRVAEETARLGWKKLEHDRALAAVKLLPKVWAILGDVKLDPQEKVARAQECLARDGARALPGPLASEPAPALEAVGAQAAA